jgi:hypothetical protein
MPFLRDWILQERTPPESEKISAFDPNRTIVIALQYILYTAHLFLKYFLVLFIY